MAALALSVGDVAAAAWQSSSGAAPCSLGPAASRWWCWLLLKESDADDLRCLLESRARDSTAEFHWNSTQLSIIPKADSYRNSIPRGILQES